MAKIFLIAFGIFIVSALAVLGFSMKVGASVAKKYAIIRGETFRIEIADTIRLRERGLSGRARMGDNEGMYFIFPFRAKYGFWMKGMKFPIDIVWIRDDVISGFEKNVQPELGIPFYKLKIFYPAERVNRVLEVKAGTADKYGWEKGEKLQLKNSR